MTDILERLLMPLQYRTIDGVDVPFHPSGPIDDLIEEAVREIDELRNRNGRLQEKVAKPAVTEMQVTDLYAKLPPFYVTKTLMGFGGEDLNRVTLNMPGDQSFVLCEMNEPRTDVQRSRWNAMAAKLSEIWKSRIA